MLKVLFAEEFVEVFILFYLTRFHPSNLLLCFHKHDVDTRQSDGFLTIPVIYTNHRLFSY